MTTDNPGIDRIELARPLLVIKDNGGISRCGYLRTKTFNKTGKVFALLTGVSNYNEMPAASVVSISDEAAKIGASIGDTGREAIAKMQAKGGDLIC